MSFLHKHIPPIRLPEEFIGYDAVLVPETVKININMPEQKHSMGQFNFAYDVGTQKTECDIHGEIISFNNLPDFLKGALDDISAAMDKLDLQFKEWNNSKKI